MANSDRTEFPWLCRFEQEWNSFFKSAVDLSTPGCWRSTEHLDQELGFVV